MGCHHLLLQTSRETSLELARYAPTPPRSSPLPASPLPHPRSRTLEAGVEDGYGGLEAWDVDDDKIDRHKVSP